MWMHKSLGIIAKEHRRLHFPLHHGLDAWPFDIYVMLVHFPQQIGVPYLLCVDRNSDVRRALSIFSCHIWSRRRLQAAAVGLLLFLFCLAADKLTTWMFSSHGLHTAQCILCKVYFSAQPNKLRPILKFEFDIPLNMCLSQLVRVCGKYICSHFCDFETLDTWFPLKYVPVSSPSSLNMPHHHHHHH